MEHADHPRPSWFAVLGNLGCCIPHSYGWPSCSADTCEGPSRKLIMIRADMRELNPSRPNHPPQPPTITRDLAPPPCPPGQIWPYKDLTKLPLHVMESEVTLWKIRWHIWKGNGINSMTQKSRALGTYLGFSRDPSWNPGFNMRLQDAHE